MKKTVIFIGGTSHSASTLLDLMLSNNPKVYSIGEVESFFHPFRPHHINPICGCGKVRCPNWDGLKDIGKWELYSEIFKQHPEIDIIVDSSKDPLWIKEQNKNLKYKNINTYNLLIWKTFNEYIFSLSKRSNQKKWKSWISYHVEYLSMYGYKEFYSVRTSNLLSNPQRVLSSICDSLNIEMIDSQELYWNKVHHTLFGSAASRIHLHEKNSTEFIRLKRFIENKESEGQDDIYDMKKYRSIYKGKKSSEMMPLVKTRSDKKIKYISKYIDAHSIFKKSDTHEFTYKPQFWLHHLKAAKRLYKAIFKEKYETYR
jgi:hypothetical protein